MKKIGSTKEVKIYRCSVASMFIIFVLCVALMMLRCFIMIEPTLFVILMMALLTSGLACFYITRKMFKIMCPK